MKILIVEDDSSMLILLQKYLASKNHSIYLSSSAEEAYQIIRNEEIDIVITDWMMPKINGIELLELVRAMKNSPAVIIITSMTSPDAKTQALDLGADDFIFKPINFSELSHKIDVLYQNRLNSISYDDKVISKDTNKIKNLVSVGIVSNTGGPKAIKQLFEGLDYSEKLSFFIFLNNPMWILEALKEQIQSFTKYNAQIASNNMPILGGSIYISPNDAQLLINTNDRKIILIKDRDETYFRPSADLSLKSLAFAFGNNSMGIILTGMGKDGCIGAGYISAEGGSILVQNPEEATSPSMPQTIIDLKIANQILGISEMRNYLNDFISNLNTKPDQEL